MNAALEVVQTGSLPWEEWYPQYVGTKCKTLFDNPDTGESLRLAFVPSEFTLASHSRHHHGSTREFVYVLFGDLPYIEYESPTASPRPFIFEEGMLLDRPPRSIHGMSVDPVSSLGALVLEWTTGPNVFNLVPFDDTSAFEGDFRARYLLGMRNSVVLGGEPHVALAKRGDTTTAARASSSTCSSVTCLTSSTSHLRHRRGLSSSKRGCSSIVPHGAFTA